jgi:ferritin-like metal-binding protein YciE
MLDALMPEKFESFNDLFLHEMKDLYSAEKQITEALPQMAEKATDPALKKAFEKHLKETENQIKRLEQIAEHLDINIEGEKCKGMEGLIKEGSKLLKSDANEFLDQALIGASQRVEHYEIAGYGCAITYAGLIKCKPAEKLLKETIAEEEKTDKALTSLARKEQKEIV